MKRKLSLIVLLLATAFAGQAYGQACQIDLAHYKMIEPGMTSAAVNQSSAVKALKCRAADLLVSPPRCLSGTTLVTVNLSF